MPVLSVLCLPLPALAHRHLPEVRQQLGTSQRSRSVLVLVVRLALGPAALVVNCDSSCDSRPDVQVAGPLSSGFGRQTFSCCDTLVPEPRKQGSDHVGGFWSESLLPDFCCFMPIYPLRWNHIHHTTQTHMQEDTDLPTKLITFFQMASASSQASRGMVWRPGFGHGKVSDTFRQVCGTCGNEGPIRAEKFGNARLGLGSAKLVDSQEPLHCGSIGAHEECMEEQPHIPQSPT